ncbi:hypothetical protein FBR06_08855 [Betaproteobacteria bacterium PRO4]|uniref:hypothetical protein n=1 Tax=Nitrosomonas sp. TaxID=42353 RepID=UPI002562F5DE|nr:hypothetical protein [Nitrosomonas sp.]MBE7526876.1 hypothetical protein [Burkholderiales bacterium]MDL1867325.1 hypothetical protein [Betaproteobacteria bacterium PRO4]
MVIAKNFANKAVKSLIKMKQMSSDKMSVSKSLLKYPKLLDHRMLSPNDSAKDNKKIADETCGRVICTSPEFR